MLVGHSYGGMVVTGVAKRMADRVKAPVDLDAFVPEHCDSPIGLLPKAMAAEVAAPFIGAFRGTALEGRSGKMGPIPAERFNVADDKRQWVDRRCVPQAPATFEMPLLPCGEHAKVVDRVSVHADGRDPSPFRSFVAKFDGAPAGE